MNEEQCLVGYFISVLMGGDEATLPDILEVQMDVARKAQPHSSVVVEEEADSGEHHCSHVIKF